MIFSQPENLGSSRGFTVEVGYKMKDYRPSLIAEGIQNPGDDYQ